MVGILPGLALGLLFAGKIQKYLYNPVTVAVMLLAGVVALILIESRKRQDAVSSVGAMSCRTAFFIGLIQCLAMVPGTSRSAATIVGAMLLGVSRVASAEYSFFLAIPSLFGASAYSVLKLGFHLTAQQALLLAVGFAVSFLVAWGVIAAFMKFISRHDFKPFGWYRIALGAFLIVYFCVLPRL